MKCNIDCMTHNKQKRQWQVTPEGRVWPCCFWSNSWDERHNDDMRDNLLMDDPKFKKLLKEDPNWNNLNAHSFDDIVAHEYYINDIYYPGWQSDNPHPLCVKECSVSFDEDRGCEIAAWNIEMTINDSDHNLLS